ncbi:ABC transporter permease [Anaerocolumna cellulosilytica]|uniref:ABC transporter permease n=1 Tax=Anaerocolumna cellulosilytica TaxID=433286 RepID=A0A6S6QU46_9FIRM|nr:FtsX-like permease family protein [Anaerocolumna cellulosilytica]MBB5197621.1 ABC-type lipoprotein release transport system permease subunit [Anaerocolumna cellulosilytica]BCJ93196.1 ABC transporter permease [Anaerocolumna cellulosilytica]
MKKILQVLINKRNSKEHKLFLCLMTVIVTSLTLFTAFNALPLLEESIKQDLRQTTVGEADYVVTPKESALFEVPTIENGKSLNILALEGGITKERYAKVFIWELDYSKFLEVFGNTYMEKGEVTLPVTLNENQVLIMPDTSDKLNINEGDLVEFTVYGQKIYAEAVIAPRDNFFVKANGEVVVMGAEILRTALDIKENQVTLSYIYKTEKGADIKANLQKQNNEIIVKEAIDPEYISANMTTYYGIDFLILVFILLIARDILKSTGLIYVTERSRFIGTLRSNGAEKRLIVRLFSNIGIKVALKGSLFGMMIGMALLITFARFGIGLTNVLQAIDIIFLAIAVIGTGAVMTILSLLSFQRPVKQLLCKSDRSLLLENVSAEMQHEKERKMDYIYCILLLVFIILSFFLSRWDMGAVLLYVITFTFILIKSMKYLFLKLKKTIQQKTGKGLFLIAAKNVGTNVYLRKTLSLTITISLFITIIGILIFSVLDAMTSFYRDYKSDAYIRVEDGKGFSDTELDKVERLSDITDTYLYYTGKVTIVTKEDERQVKVVGLDDPIDYNDNFMNLNLDWVKGFDIATFTQSRNAILSEILCNRFGFQLGDTVTLYDGESQKDYYIAGITPSLQELGDAIYISRYDSEFLGGSIKNGLYLKCTNMANMEDSIENILYERTYTFKDVTEMKQNDVTNGMQIIIFFVSFATLVGMASITGIYSNYKLSYMMRRKEFAILVSTGYSKKNIFHILMGEITLISLIGYLIGMLIMWVIKKPLESLMKFVELPIELNLSGLIFLALFFVVLINTLLNIVLAHKSSQLSAEGIIEVLKK